MPFYTNNVNAIAGHVLKGNNSTLFLLFKKMRSSLTFQEFLISTSEAKKSNSIFFPLIVIVKC